MIPLLIQSLYHLCRGLFLSSSSSVSDKSPKIQRKDVLSQGTHWRYGNLLANRFLATMMFLHSALLLQMSFQGLVGLDAKSTLVMTLIGTAFAVGPLHYLYAKYLSQPGAKVSRREFIHFIPFLFYEVLVLVFYNPSGTIALYAGPERAH